MDSEEFERAKPVTIEQHLIGDINEMGQTYTNTSYSCAT